MCETVTENFMPLLIKQFTPTRSPRYHYSRHTSGDTFGPVQRQREEHRGGIERGFPVRIAWFTVFL